MFDPERGEYVEVKDVAVDVDTLRFRSVTEEEYEPIISDAPMSGVTLSGENEVILKDAYNVVYLLPFLANQLDTMIPENSDWAIHFANGSELALNQMGVTTPSINAHFLDTEATKYRLQNLLATSEPLKNADLIIGPYRRDNIRLVADFAKANEIPLVSPYSAVSKITEDNPYFMQVVPGLAAHFNSIAQHALRNVDSIGALILVAADDNNGRKRVAFLQDQMRRIIGNDTLNVKKWLIPLASEAGQDQIDLRSFLPTKEEMEEAGFEKEALNNTFVIANSNEAFVFSLLRNINIHRNKGKVSVYGMPQWYDFNMVDYELWEQLGVHLTQSAFVDPSVYEAQTFRRQYFNQFNAIPEQSAYLGYDVTRYFVRQLLDNGRNFPAGLESNVGSGLSTRFDLRGRDYSDTPMVEGKPMPIDVYENSYVNVLRFMDYHFSIAK